MKKMRFLIVCFILVVATQTVSAENLFEYLWNGIKSIASDIFSRPAPPNQVNTDPVALAPDPNSDVAVAQLVEEPEAAKCTLELRPLEAPRCEDYARFGGAAELCVAQPGATGNSSQVKGSDVGTSE